MKSYNLKKMIPLVMLMGGLGIVFAFGVKRFPKKMGNELSEQRAEQKAERYEHPRLIQREVSSKKMDSKEVAEEIESSAEGYKEKLKNHSEVEESHAKENLSKEINSRLLHQPSGQVSDQVSGQVSGKKDSICQSVELRGDGENKVHVTSQDWGKTVDLFHHSKELLLGWVKENKNLISGKTVTVLENQIHELKIVQPGAIQSEELDLSWRGIGVWSRDDKNGAMIHFGKGFIKLVVEDPKRSAFEMMRLVAQAWSPCELKRLGADPIWNPLLKCLGEEEDQNCASEVSAEGAWGVSSVLAVGLENPGCKLPIFSDGAKEACLKQFLEKVKSVSYESPSPTHALPAHHEVEKEVKK